MYAVKETPLLQVERSWGHNFGLAEGNMATCLPEATTSPLPMSRIWLATSVTEKLRQVKKYPTSHLALKSLLPREVVVAQTWMVLPLVVPHECKVSNVRIRRLLTRSLLSVSRLRWRVRHRQKCRLSTQPWRQKCTNRPGMR